MAEALLTVNGIVNSRKSRQAVPMYRNILFLVPCLLSGCIPLSIYYREGASLDLVERDTLRCEVQALEKAPVANQIRRDPPTYVPGRKVCKENGVCYVTAGHFIPGEVYSVDVNADLRRRVERQCMADKGYAPTDIPACSNAVAQSAPARVTTTLPRLTAKSCFIRYNSDQIQIVTRE